MFLLPILSYEFPLLLCIFDNATFLLGLGVLGFLLGCVNNFWSNYAIGIELSQASVFSYNFITDVGEEPPVSEIVVESLG